MRYCHFGVSPVNYSDSDCDMQMGNDRTEIRTAAIFKSHDLSHYNKIDEEAKNLFERTIYV